MYKTKELLNLGDKDLKASLFYKNNIISVGRFPEIYIYNLETKETLTINTNLNSISSAIIYEDKLILGTQIGTIIIYNDILNNTTPLYLSGHTQCVCSLDAHNHFLLSSSWDGSIRIWDLLNLRQLDIFTLNNCVWQARFFKQNDNNYQKTDFYVCCSDKSIITYKKKEIYKTFLMHITAVRGIFYFNNYFYSIGNDGKIMKSDNNGKLLKVVDLHEFVFCLDMNENKIFVCGENGIIVVLDLDLNVIWKHKCDTQSCWNIKNQNDNIYVSGSNGKLFIYEEGTETIEKIEDENAYKLKDKNYKIENGRAYCLINDQWTLVGDVVDKTYDHSFSVEVDNRYLTISFNENDDVYNVADKFIAENNLHKEYRDDIVNFIKKNYTPKNAMFLYKEINIQGIKKFLKDEFIIENLNNPDNKNSMEVEKRLKKLMNEEEDNFFVLDCYRYFYAYDYELDLTFLQGYNVRNKKEGTVFLRLVCNMFKKLPFNIAIIQKKIDKIIDEKMVDENTISNYLENRSINDK